MMTHMSHFSCRANPAGTPDIQIIRYCMNRIVHLVNEVAESGEQIIDPELMDTWFPKFTNQLDACHNDLLHSTTELKKR